MPNETPRIAVAVVIHEQPTKDTDVTVFATADLAIAYASRTARVCDRDGDLDEELTTSMIEAGWLYHASYGDENHIRVQLRDVQESLS